MWQLQQTQEAEVKVAVVKQRKIYQTFPQPLA
jgi:hypothetical protein